MPARLTDNNLDDTDLSILELMTSNLSNREISSKLKIPMSTIQRRTRRLLNGGVIKQKYEIDYKRLGYKKGLLHIYLNDGNSQEMAEKLLAIRNVLSVSIHLGNSDVVVEYVCLDSTELLDLIASIKHLPEVDKVVWSEQVVVMPVAKIPMPELVKIKIATSTGIKKRKW